MSTERKRDLYLSRWGALKTERSSWFSHWHEISDYLAPRSGRFFLTDRNRGEKRHNNILDSTGTRAARVLAAGLMAGMTSPARPWFRLATPDRDLMEFGPVKVWLAQVADGMRNVFAHSNTYRALHASYTSVAQFGTLASIAQEDFEDVIRHFPLEIGEYAVATDDRGVVNTLYREFELTVAQIVAKFGLENCSESVRNRFRNGHHHDSYVPVLHVVEPRADRDLRKRDPRNMPWASCYIEIGRSDPRGESFLRESGYKRFPALVARWEVKGTDPYGNSCPGMEALGDVKQLQHEQLRKAQGIDFQTLPPMQAPPELKDQTELFPGGVTYTNAVGPNAGLRRVFDVDVNLNYLLADIQDVRGRIKQAFYEDLFLMLANDQRSGVTAREIAERHEEKLLMLGPVLENLHDELLQPLIDVTFDRMLEAGLVPPPPQELQGIELSVQFVSTLAQAQRAVGLQSVDRLIGTIGSIAQFKPSVLDKLDEDQIVDAYADMLGVDPNLIVADDRVAVIRQERQKQAAAQASAEQMPAAAQTAKTLSETDTAGRNALTDVMGLFSGYAG